VRFVLCFYYSPVASQRPEKTEMEAFTELTETPDFIVAKVNGATHRTVGSVTWFGSLLERNNRAKDGDRTLETILGGCVLFGLESLSLLD
jgi:hypothetical protein